MIDNRENNVWTVYVHIVPKAITKYDYDKYYVGITSKSVDERWGRNGSGYCNQFFYYAIKKYGWNNIEHHIIANHLTVTEAQDLENKLIKILKCNINENKYGYNSCDGGALTTKGYKHRKETKEKISKSKLGKKLINSAINVETYQFDLNFNFIAKYYSVQEASRVLNIKSANIRRCLNNIQYSYNNYIWRKKEDIIIKNNTYFPINLIEKPKYNRKIYQFDLYGNCICIYKKLDDVLKSNKNYKIENITHCLRHINKTAYNYIWTYEEELCIIDGKPQLKEINLQRKKYKTHENPKYIIYQFDINGNFIKKYLNCKHASKETFVDNSSIAKVAKKNKKTAGGYIWRYEKDVRFDKNGKAYFIE